MEMKTLSSFVVDKQFEQICEPLKDDLFTHCYEVEGSLKAGAFWMLGSLTCYYLASLNLLCAADPTPDPDADKESAESNQGTGKYRSADVSGYFTPQAPQHLDIHEEV